MNVHFKEFNKRWIFLFCLFGSLWLFHRRFASNALKNLPEIQHSYDPLSW